MEKLKEATNRTGDPADLQEFYRTANLKDPHLNDRPEEWQFYYKRSGVPVSTFS